MCLGNSSWEMRRKTYYMGTEFGRSKICWFIVFLKLDDFFPKRSCDNLVPIFFPFPSISLTHLLNIHVRLNCFPNFLYCIYYTCVYHVLFWEHSSFSSQLELDNRGPGWCVSVDWVPGLQAKESPVWLPVRAHAWVAGQVPSRVTQEATTHWCFSLSKN